MSKTKKSDSRVNPELKGFQITVDNFGEINTNYDIDKINRFLDREVEDKKLRDREDYKTIKKEAEAELNTKKS